MREENDAAKGRTYRLAQQTVTLTMALLIVVITVAGPMTDTASAQTSTSSASGSGSYWDSKGFGCDAYDNGARVVRPDFPWMRPISNHPETVYWRFAIYDASKEQYISVPGGPAETVWSPLYRSGAFYDRGWWNGDWYDDRGHYVTDTGVLVTGAGPFYVWEEFWWDSEGTWYRASDWSRFVGGGYGCQYQ